MLVSLSIRRFVIISSLDAEFGAGFCALTGETGVGKSVIISAIRTALGARADPSLVAPGNETAIVTAVFVPETEDHPILALLEESGIETEGTLTFRRVIRAQGGGRAFINDQPVSVATLRTAGELLVEIQNQRASHKLLDADGQMALLDGFSGTNQNRMHRQSLWNAWRDARARLETMTQRQDTLRTNAQFCRDALAELDALDPQPEEAMKLGAQRRALQCAAEIGQTLAVARTLLEGRDDGPEDDTGAIAAMAKASAQLTRLSDTTPETRDARDAIERALAEADEATRALRAARDGIEHAPETLDTIERRLFAITAAARKHDADPDHLDVVRERLATELADFASADDQFDALRHETNKAKELFSDAVRALSEKRAAGAVALAEAVMRELPPMRLQAVRFRVSLTAREQAGPDGAEKVVFEVATNRDTPFGPLSKIASGGEFSRIALALGLCRSADSVATLIFDEADAGIGGATAAAVGERLARLAADRQVLAVTHSPQVAAASSAQWRIYKEEREGRTEAGMTLLADDSRTEEIARMISGTRVTAEARAAAERLLAGA